MAAWRQYVIMASKHGKMAAMALMKKACNILSSGVEMGKEGGNALYEHACRTIGQCLTCALGYYSLLLIDVAENIV